jgi:hypothetical protein
VIVAEVWDTEDLYHLLAEVVMGIGPEGSTLPDTPKVREMREKLVKEVAEAEARGHTVDVPHEWA